MYNLQYYILLIPVYTESSSCRFCLKMVICAFWTEAGKYKALVFGGDLLFFTSPTSQPPASMAVHRTGWYFRRGLFPFLASNYIPSSMSLALLGQTCNKLTTAHLCFNWVY